MHTTHKPTAGGIAIFVAFSIGVYFSSTAINSYIVSSFLVIFLLGVYDDKFGSTPRTKLIWIILASLLLYFGELYIDYLGIFAGHEVAMNTLFAILFTAFATVGFVNAMNLIDGLDGLSSGIGIVILTSFAYIGFKYSDVFLFYLAMFLIFALLGFMVFNWHPSKIFMGDSGSLTLGFVIVVLAIHAVSENYITPVSILLLTAVPILDTLIVMLRRIVKGKNPFSPDKTHLHHIVLKQQLKNVPKTTKVLILMQAIFTYIGLGFKVRDDIVILGVFAMLFTLFYVMFTVKRS
jgi:UDP-GlcNAc:undecaprenyl-phosphate GlcNAc-1-phosphate transferase